MPGSRDRREFLRLVVGASSLALASPKLVAAQAGEGGQTHPQIGTTPLAGNLRLVSGAGGNVVVLNGPEGVLLVNGGSVERSPALLEALAGGSGGKRVEVLFNTDWHPDHTGSNGALRTRGARVIAHEHAKQYMGSERYVDWQKKTYAPLPAMALPTQTFYTSGTLMFGGEHVQYGHLGQAHTDSDIYIFFADSNVLVAGDALAVDRYPICDYTTGGWIGGLLTATRTMLELTNAQTQIVPGSGPVQTRAGLQAQLDMLTAVRERLIKMMRSGLSADEMLAAGATKEFDAKWGDPTLFVRTNYRGMWLHVRELGGII
jgi:glyoxylase-like metal-dependent hydrolase (beta-lactamase superfamily II)